MAGPVTPGPRHSLDPTPTCPGNQEGISPSAIEGRRVPIASRLPKETSMPGPGRFTVLVADFLEESSVETSILKDVASLTVCKALQEDDLASHLHGADAILLFHDIPILGEATFAQATRCRCVVRAGVGYNNVDID